VYSIFSNLNKISTLLFLAQQMPYRWYNDNKIDQE
jgi:hypothetical protein